MAEPRPVGTMRLVRDVPIEHMLASFRGERPDPFAEPGHELCARAEAFRDASYIGHAWYADVDEAGKKIVGGIIAQLWWAMGESQDHHERNGS